MDITIKTRQAGELISLASVREPEQSEEPVEAILMCCPDCLAPLWAYSTPQGVTLACPACSLHGEPTFDYE